MTTVLSIVDEDISCPWTKRGSVAKSTKKQIIFLSLKNSGILVAKKILHLRFAKLQIIR
jgi:hypothetical protein